jgi:MFS family permease
MSCLAICGFAAIGGALFGFDISSMSGVLGTKAYQNYFNNPSGTRQGGITASMPAGSLGAILQTASNGVALLCIGRVVAGWAIGVCSAIVPVYQAEIAPKNIRGRVVSLQQWAITWGILIQYVRSLSAYYTQRLN